MPEITLKINLKKNIFRLRTHGESMNSASRRSGITYPTYWRMAKGKWNPESMQTLARYLASLGYTAEELAETPIGYIFDVTRESNNE